MPAVSEELEKLKIRTEDLEGKCSAYYDRLCDQIENRVANIPEHGSSLCLSWKSKKGDDIFAIEYSKDSNRTVLARVHLSKGHYALNKRLDKDEKIISLEIGKVLDSLKYFDSTGNSDLFVYQ